jgi:hypothetical protein
LAKDRAVTNQERPKLEAVTLSDAMLLAELAGAKALSYRKLLMGVRYI